MTREKADKVSQFVLYKPHYNTDEHQQMHGELIVQTRRVLTLHWIRGNREVSALTYIYSIQTFWFLSKLFKF